MAVIDWLIDKSAMVRFADRPEADDWAGRIERGGVRITIVTRREVAAPSIVDLLIAAAAELAGLTVLHLDKDFELIAGVTGQPVQRPAV